MLFPIKIEFILKARYFVIKKKAKQAVDETSTSTKNLTQNQYIAKQNIFDGMTNDVALSSYNRAEEATQKVK